MPMPAVLEDTRSRPASPKRVLFRVVATIFIVEALIMVALHAVGDSLLLEELKQDAACARRQGTRVGVLFVDVDGFKRLNDLLGHETGDAVLRDVAAHLRGSIRESDLAARWGGDEFVVLLTGLTDPEAAGVVAGKIVEAFRPPSLAERPDVAVSLSIGVAICPEDPHEILRRADAAMYEAKRAGKNTFRRAGPGR